MITIMHTHEDGTVLLGSRRGDGVYEIAAGHGFHYRSSAGIHLPGSRDRDARTHTINDTAQALRDNGFEVQVHIDDQWRPAAVREAARSQRADERADRLNDDAHTAAVRRDGYQTAGDRVFAAIPAGQPMMPDHHSYPRDRAIREKAWANLDRAADAGRRATDLSRRADAVRDHADAKDDPRAIMRRIERLEADLRSAQRELTSAVEARCSQPYLDACQRQIDRLAEDIAHQRGKLAAGAESGQFVAWSPDNLSKGDRVKVGSSGWFTITRVNKKSVSLNSRDYPTKATFDQIYGRRRDGWQIDAPNASAWPVATAVAVATWQRLERESTLRSCEEQLRLRVRWAIRIVHGLPLDAADVEVTAFRPEGKSQEAIDERRRLMIAYAAVFDRLAAGETVTDIQTSLPPDPVEPLWRMPSGEPETVRADRVEPGTIVKGVWEHGSRGKTLWPHFCGPVAAVSQVKCRDDYRHWVTVTLHDGTAKDFTTSQWLAVYPRPPRT